MKKILIDCDPGHDDALALMLAHAHPKELEIVAISTIGGNQTLEKVTNNARKILELLGAEIPLLQGQANPLMKQAVHAPEAHGESGMDGPVFRKPSYPIEEENALLYMYNMLMKSEEKVTIVAMGPLTNIALLVKTFPEIMGKIEQIVLMGGGIRRGNATRAAEFNIYVDPEAAKIVYESGLQIVMAGLDVTEKATLTLEEIHTLENQGEICQVAFELLRFYNESGRQFGFEDSALHDVCTIAYLLRPDFFKGKTYSVEILTEENSVRGMTLADRRRRPEGSNSIFVLEDVNRDEFSRFFLESLKRMK